MLTHLSDFVDGYNKRNYIAINVFVVMLKKMI